MVTTNKLDISLLCDDIIINICSFLNKNDIETFRKVCKSIYNCVNDYRNHIYNNRVVIQPHGIKEIKKKYATLSTMYVDGVKNGIETFRINKIYMVKYYKRIFYNGILIEHRRYINNKEIFATILKNGEYVTIKNREEKKRNFILEYETTYAKYILRID